LGYLFKIKTMQQTTVQLIFENWKNLNRLEFDEFMLNQEKTLLREERESIIHAHINGQSEFDKNAFSQKVIERANNYFYENFKTEDNGQN